MKKIKELYDDIMELTGEITKDHVGAYAAQTAFFFMLCMIPIILLLLTMVQYTPVTKADVMTATGISIIGRFIDYIHCQSGL